MKIVQKKFPVLMRDQELAREVEKRAVKRQEEVRETAKRIEVVAVGLFSCFISTTILAHQYVFFVD